MKAASAFAHMTVAFTRRLEWSSLSAALAEYVKRLQFGSKIDVLPLVEIKGAFELLPPFTLMASTFPRFYVFILSFI